MANTITQTRLSFDDYLAMPEMQRRYDILDGEMIMSPAPTGEHNWVVLSLALILRVFAQKHRPGVVVVAPWDVLIQRDPLRTRQPDVLFVSTERSGFRMREDLRDISCLEVPPELVVEVVSRSNTRSRIEAKLQDYCVIGVSECWLAYAKQRSVEVLGLSRDGTYGRSRFGPGETLRSRVFPELQVAVDEVFAS